MIIFLFMNSNAYIYFLIFLCVIVDIPIVSQPSNHSRFITPLHCSNPILSVSLSLIAYAVH
jgi:hypothetical protein